MEAVYPAAASALTRGRRRKRTEPRQRHRTMPVTFAEIKEVDEDKEDEQIPMTASNISITSVEERRRKPDLLDDTLGRQFTEFRNRRTRRRRDIIHEPDEIEDHEPSEQSEPT
ncbi:unnamed protein product [Pieris macdunnoughi]|uniref:Uncharacterized protein n=1 Tax=Pieris macdunnoughi TaxID=345717 RepID=A0A821VJF1_9NEOP|nr:unnamed protein product [Pieris macdunnoughi]